MTHSSSFLPVFLVVDVVLDVVVSILDSFREARMVIPDESARQAGRRHLVHDANGTMTHCCDDPHNHSSHDVFGHDVHVSVSTTVSLVAVDVVLLISATVPFWEMVVSTPLISSSVT